MLIPDPVLNIIAFNRAVSFYPVHSFEKKLVIPFVQETMSFDIESHKKAIDKYKGRGWVRPKLSHVSVKNDVRWVGDAKCWTIHFKELPQRHLPQERFDPLPLNSWSLFHMDTAVCLDLHRVKGKRLTHAYAWAPKFYKDARLFVEVMQAVESQSW